LYYINNQKSRIKRQHSQKLLKFVKILQKLAYIKSAPPRQPIIARWYGLKTLANKPLKTYNKIRLNNLNRSEKYYLCFLSG